jgi:hypothetical protein
MSDYVAHYSALLSSPEQIRWCQEAQSLPELLTRLRYLWQCPQLSDNELLGEISRLNCTPLESHSAHLAGHWLPYRYQANKKQVYWLIPTGHATEPFQDETILCYRQQLFNQIIQPCSSLEFVAQQSTNMADVQPAGFIFHLSRCGSTLISGCLSELESTCVFSESPLLTELLLDDGLSLPEQQFFLRSFINLQAAVFPHRPQMIIKWNAWDIFRWELIGSLYPQVPAIFLVRDPVEILASHQRMPGWHMAGDMRLAGIHPVFSLSDSNQTLLMRRSQVLAALLAEMNKYQNNPGVLPVDYPSLDAEKIKQICHHFSILPPAESFPKITQRLQFHSKTPGVVFANDSGTKQAIFSVAQKTGIQKELMPLYQLFFDSECKNN